MLLRFLILLGLSACSSLEVNNEKLKTSSVELKVYVISPKIKLECSGANNCEEWSLWLKDLIKKSSKHKINQQFYLDSPKEYFQAKNFLELLDKLGEVTISYGDYHCLDNQISCTFEGENKIFFNSMSLRLNKIDWLRIFWHEIFHLSYPAIAHVECTSCVDKKSQVFVECDKNSFSSYGLEYYWLKTHAIKYSSDKNFTHHKKKMLQELSNRICRKNSRI